MKTLVIFTLFCVITGTQTANEPISLSEAEEQKLAQDLDDCIEEEAEVTAREAHNIKNWDVEKPSNSMKCVSACFFEKFGILRDNQIQEEVAAQKLKPIINERRTKELISRCKDVKGSERCETGFKIFQCVWNYRAF